MHGPTHLRDLERLHVIQRSHKICFAHRSWKQGGCLLGGGVEAALIENSGECLARPGQVEILREV
jgi:hypothetical protein